MIGNKLLFTPGPLTTSPSVKAATLRDAGSRDTDFLAVVREIRERLRRLFYKQPAGRHPRDRRFTRAIFDAYGALFDVHSLIMSAGSTCPETSPRFRCCGGRSSLNTPGCDP
jgi:hypothetical protein